MAFSVLGPLRVAVHGNPVRLSAGKQRALLAALLLSANEPVAQDQLVRWVWDRTPPLSPRAALHTCLTRLRHTLDHHTPGLSAVVRTCSAGYLVEAGPDQLDLLRFRRLAAHARQAAARGDHDSESAALRQALALWSVPVLPEIRSEALRRDLVARVTEEWLPVRERAHELALARGRHDPLIAELRDLVRQFPFHEGFWRQLVLALYRAGRRVEALETYAELSARLREETGMDPCPESRDLHLAVLRGDPGLATAAGAPATVPAARTGQTGALPEKSGIEQ
ncbi:AfsR/SARP family transcriptional regulator [Streptomonospora sp. S1-112]|uniref:AfsR/SARP family transcriptional regulator n=1 Tax=Streptomonospora mangrovi TaxID=2883123 RepID=A0A9X3NR83_9ACTN|nr:AfsR/SARP family transcriptional regulator [Streptomonospora mangrovi]MDA0566913.1 AfsR/SARP family transcriptional regulator [Streptomonospora mangrovi]